MQLGKLDVSSPHQGVDCKTARIGTQGNQWVASRKQNLKALFGALANRTRDIAAGMVLAAGLTVLALLLDCAIRSWRGEVEYPYGGADDRT